jgi:hypothetical protein
MTDNNSCPLPAKWRVPDFIADSDSPYVKGTIGRINSVRKECARELDEYLATRAQQLYTRKQVDSLLRDNEESLGKQQLAADGIVEECAKAAENIMCMAGDRYEMGIQQGIMEAADAVRALKGKCLLSAQPNGGLTEEIRATIIHVLQNDLVNAQDNVARAKMQQKRMPFDHDNNNALVRCEEWERKSSAALNAALKEKV